MIPKLYVQIYLMSNKKKICTNLLDFFVRMDTIGVDPPGKYTHTHRDTLKGTTNRNTKITVLSIGGGYPFFDSIGECK